MKSTINSKVKSFIRAHQFRAMLFVRKEKNYLEFFTFLNFKKKYLPFFSSNKQISKIV